LLHIVGECEKRIFGLRPAQRLEHQMRKRDDVILVVDASAVIDDGALDWLVDHRGTVIASMSGRALAVAVDSSDVASAKRAVSGQPTQLPVVIPQGEQFVRKLRRRVALGAYSLADEPVEAIEKRLFSNVYKGVTDIVTKYVWPWPAFHVTRFCARLGITPNSITFVGVILVFVAGWFFYQGDLPTGLAAAWLMTFLDTVDGKLARVTNSSSAFGNLLDHGTDVIHPPIWWFCLAHGLVVSHPADSIRVWPAFWIILSCYLIGRIVEISFHRCFGFNQYIWQPLDSAFRLIVSRRNIILLIMTVGLILGLPVMAYLLCAAWSVISTAIQLIRITQAFVLARRRPVTSWLY